MDTDGNIENFYMSNMLHNVQIVCISSPYNHDIGFSDIQFNINCHFQIFGCPMFLEVYPLMGTFEKYWDMQLYKICGSILSKHDGQLKGVLFL